MHHVPRSQRATAGRPAAVSAHRPVHSGFRFSANAFGPSTKSADASSRSRRSLSLRKASSTLTTGPVEHGLLRQLHRAAASTEDLVRPALGRGHQVGERRPPR